MPRSCSPAVRSCWNCAAAEVQRVDGARLVGGPQVFPGRLEAAAGVGQGVPQLRPQSAPVLGVVRREVEGHPVEAGGAVEGQGPRGGLRGLGVEPTRGRRLARLVEVGSQDLGIGPPRRDEHARQPAVAFLQGHRREMRHDRLANPIVVRLDRVELRRPGATDQPGRGRTAGALDSSPSRPAARHASLRSSGRPETATTSRSRAPPPTVDRCAM